ncbi:MAG: RNA polymerase sigma factor [Bacteroidia bacterium]
MKEAEYLSLINTNQARLERICRFYCRDGEDQKDLMQEIVFQIWRSRERYRGDAKLNTWLYRIAINTALAYLRKQKKDRWQGLDDKEKLLSTIENPAKILENQDRINHLMGAIKELKKLDQTVILLYLEELSYQEIAQVTGLSETNVGAKLSRIKKKISQKLSQRTGHELG